MSQSRLAAYFADIRIFRMLGAAKGRSGSQVQPSGACHTAEDRSSDITAMQSFARRSIATSDESKGVA
jgi:hypothetical protein